MQNLLEDLTNQLDTSGEFTDENGNLLKNKIIESAFKLDSALIKILLKNDALKKHFFTDIDGVLVFDKIKFQNFVSNKQFLPDNYTAFKNKIGLVDGKNDDIASKEDVTLVWPYKDCVLEGGQTKEEQKRDEIFWNETLAHDEIDRLLDPKVLTNCKRYDESGEHILDGSEKVDFDNSNLIIKGNNLLALHSICDKYAGKVKLIYIDPPFNTRNDSFGYNDKFNHSTWLTFIKNRLEIAKKFLSYDGSIWIHIDENESHYLKIICDEIFDGDNFIIQTVVQRGAATGHKSINPGPVQVSDILLTYAKNKADWRYEPVYQERTFDEAYKYFIDNYNEPYEKWIFCTLKESLKKLNISLEECVKKYPERIIRFAQPDYDGVGRETKQYIDMSKNEPTKIFLQKRNGFTDMYFYGGERILFYKDKLRIIDGKLVTAELVTNIWTDMNYQGISKEGGIRLKKGKKPEALIKRILEMCTVNDDLVMDFFAGSGTLGAVAHKMDRQYIIIEQLDYIHELPEKRLKNVIKGDASGISKVVNWKGGGSFIYCELMQWNEVYMEKIQKTKTAAELKAIWIEISNKAFYNYFIDVKTINENISDFDRLSIEDQKKFLIETLDKNQLYVNYSEIKDANYNVSDTDIKLNSMFYSRN
jgi:adenine-specific DNA-methyltransferase